MADPKFIDKDSGNWRLKPGSPCVNAGVIRAGMQAVDIDGRRRLDKFSELLDMGCYEYVPSGVMFGFQ